MATTEERTPPRWAIAKGVPADAVPVVSEGAGLRFVHGDDVYGMTPNGEFQRTTWRKPTPAPAPEPKVMTTEDAVRSLAHPPLTESFEEFCARQQALGLAVQLGMVTPVRPKPAPEPERSSLDCDAFRAYMEGLKAMEASPEYAEWRERSAKLSDRADLEERQRLAQRARSSNRRLAARAERELEALDVRVAKRADRR